MFLGMKATKIAKYQMLATVNTMTSGPLVQGYTYTGKLVARGTNWFTVKLGGYNGRQPSKTLFNFEAKLIEVI